MPSYNAALRGWAVERRLALFDVEALFDNLGAAYFSDECHLTKDGHRTLAEALASVLSPRSTAPGRCLKSLALSPSLRRYGTVCLSAFSFLRFSVARFSPELRFTSVSSSTPREWACDTKTAATVWAPSYKRATVMQAPLAALSFLAGVGAWLFGGGILWLIGAVLIGLVIPFTFIGVMPTNHQLLAPGRDLSSAGNSISRWISGALATLVRSALSFLGAIVYLVSLFRS